ncbi:hypothetical protein Q4485_16890 [Granulosicoccaceae sp. 1_MG-2023]|nr:hypothetical protein [Granulosicoccaceae sp. 1_MG-2023]
MSKKILLAVFLCVSNFSYAGVYSDDLSRCLVASSTPEDRATLAKWMFTSMARHPAVVSMSSVTDQQRDSTNKAVADMFVSLIADSCVTQTKDALRYEGELAMSQAFELLGKVAATELFAHPDVAQALTSLEQHIDIDKLASVFE